MARKNLVAATPGGSITQEMIVGFVTWFTMPDEDVSLSRLRGVWAANGLDHETLPKGTKAHHVFQRAVRSIETRKRNGHNVEIKVDEVGEDMDTITYQVTKMVRDQEERLIEHPKAMRVVFDRQSEEIAFDTTIQDKDEVTRKELVPYMEAINAFYESNRTKIPGHKIRTIIRHILLRQLHGENLRGKSGGVYFIPRQGKDTLDGLADALTDLFKSGNAFLHTLPMVNDKSQRQMVRDRHVANAMDDIDEILQRTTKLARSRERAVRSNVVEDLWANHRRIKERASLYREILEDESEELTDKLDILEAQVQKIERSAGL